MFVESTSSMFLYSCNETLHMLTSESVDVQYTILSPVLSSSPSYVTLNFVSKFLSDDGGSISHCLSGFISNCLPSINDICLHCHTCGANMNDAFVLQCISSIYRCKSLLYEKQLICLAIN